MQAYWKPGEQCVLRSIIHDRVWQAESVIVVKDDPDETVLLLVPGAQCAHSEGYWRWKQGDLSKGDRWQEMQQEWMLRNFIWKTNRILTILEPDKYYACCLFWNDEAHQFTGYYINFQLPFRRSHCGFDTLDLELDLVIAPDFSWQWKDMPDYETGIQNGSIQSEWVDGIEQAQPEIFERLELRHYPFDGAWLSWQQDPSWGAPAFPDNWKKI